MSPAISIVLDLLRFTLALIVAFGHVTLPAFQEGWPDIVRSSVIAVGGFFVLSGYIIRMITLDVRDAAGVRKYFADRAARLLSITWPALVVTVLCTATAAYVNPEYHARFLDDGDDHALPRYVINAVLFTQPYGLDLVPKANNPLWSLGYEAGFYVFWGFILQARVHPYGALFTVLALVVYGPHVALMFPCWLLGVVLYDQTARATDRNELLRLSALGLVTSAAFAFVLLFFGDKVASAWRFLLEGGIESLGMSRGRLALSYVMGAIGCYFGLLAVLPLAKLLEARWSPPAWAVRGSRQIGEATFPLYAFHMPLLVLAASLAFYDRSSPAQKLMLLGGIVALSFALVPLGDWLKRRIGTVLRGAR